MPDFPSIADNFRAVQERVRDAAIKCGRDPASVRVVAVTKKMGVEEIRAAARAGAILFGENYVQEAREKISALCSENLAWHFIGRLQTNKAKYAARLFSMIHTIDSAELAQELDRRIAPERSPMPVLLQVNVARDRGKSGVSPELAPDLARKVSECRNLRLSGLMTLPPHEDDPEKNRPHFAALAELARRIKDMGLFPVATAELSMGMSHDLEAAIKEGATLVRVGTAIFGERE